MRPMPVIKKLTAIGLASLSLSAFADSAVVYTGYDSNEDADTLYAGVVSAISGDLESNGFLIRGNIAYTDYEYDTASFANGVDGEASRVELGAGYQWITDAAKYAVYLSADYQDHDLTPDDTANKSRGDELGGALQLEAYSKSTKYDMSAVAAFSTANDTYWSRGRLGVKLAKATIGGEISFSGSESYDEQRYGVYTNVPMTEKVSLGASLGHSESEGDGSREDNEGAYFQLGLSYSF